MEIIKEMHGKIQVISVKGRIDSQNVNVFGQALEESIKEGNYQILLHLKDLHYLSSSALRVLYKSLAMIDKASSLKGKIILAEPSAEVKKIFDYIDLSFDFPIFAKKEDALKALLEHY